MLLLLFQVIGRVAGASVWWAHNAADTVLLKFYMSADKLASCCVFDVHLSLFLLTLGPCTADCLLFAATCKPGMSAVFVFLLLRFSFRCCCWCCHRNISAHVVTWDDDDMTMISAAIFRPVVRNKLSDRVDEMIKNAKCGKMETLQEMKSQ